MLEYNAHRQTILKEINSIYEKITFFYKHFDRTHLTQVQSSFASELYDLLSLRNGSNYKEAMNLLDLDGLIQYRDMVAGLWKQLKSGGTAENFTENRQRRNNLPNTPTTPKAVTVQAAPVDPLSRWQDNGDGTFTALPGATLWGLFGPDWREKSGFMGDPRTLQPGTVVGRRNDDEEEAIDKIWSDTVAEMEKMPVDNSLRNRFSQAISSLNLPEWERPVFTIGFSANATGPLMSGAADSGMYFVPRSRDDSLFYIALASFISSPLPLRSLALKGLISRSYDYGFFGSVASGTGAGLSASIGVSIGVFRSINDFRGAFGETGVSGTIKIKLVPVSIGVDAVFNIDGVGPPVGFVFFAGIGASASAAGLKPSNLEGHARVGVTFAKSIREQIERRRLRQ